MRDSLDNLFDRATEHLVELLACATYSVEKMCESPIEKSFIQGIYLHHFLTSGKFPTATADNWNRDIWLVEHQKQIINYRVDFLISASNIKVQIIVECDGHDFHERTKEQAAKDRSRDRALTAAGYRVVRFTGSEIWKDPWQCAVDIENQIISAWHQENE